MKNTPSPEYSFDIGKIPPQATELEEVVLGAMMLESHCIDTVTEILQPEAFYKDSHQKIYQAIIDINRKNDPVDILTVSERLQNSGELDQVGGRLIITKLTDRISSSANVESHARIILQKYLQRLIIQRCTELIRDAYNDITDPLELVEQFGKEYDGLSTMAQSGAEMVHISQAVTESVIELKKREEYAKLGKVSGIPTPLKDLNKLLGGWQKSDLIIIAARPSMGKTAFML